MLSDTSFNLNHRARDGTQLSALGEFANSWFEAESLGFLGGDMSRGTGLPGSRSASAKAMASMNSWTALLWARCKAP